MDLKHIKGVGPAKQARLKEAGIATVEDLARCKVADVAERTGYSEKQVRELQARAAAAVVVEDAKNLGPASVGAFADEALANLKAVYEASADLLARELKHGQERVARWQKEVQESTQRLLIEAQTADGRKRIAVATRQAATDGAHKAQEQARELAQRVHTESHALAERAREIQKRAPSTLQEARERTESILKDAQAQIRLVAERAQTRVQADVEKVKGAREKFTPSKAKR
ncbi:MAG: DUF4332 domain-containing protein [Thermoplasmatota archaeon]